MKAVSAILTAALLLTTSGCDWGNGAALLGMAPFATAGMGSQARVAAGSAANWRTPNQLRQDGQYAGASYSCFEEGSFGVVVSYFGGERDEELVTASLDYSIDLLPGNGRGGGRWRCTARPEVGGWNWSESPEENGYLLGLTLAPGFYLGERYELHHSIWLEVTWQWLMDVDAEENAGVFKIMFGYTLGETSLDTTRH